MALPCVNLTRVNYRLSFFVCFQVGWATREILWGLEGRRGAAAVLNYTCFVVGVLIHPVNVMQGARSGVCVSDQIRSVAQSCPTLCDPMNCSRPGLPVHHQLLEFTQTHVHRVSDAIQPSHPLSSPSPPAPNPSQHQSLLQWVYSLHEVAKVLEFQL